MSCQNTTSPPFVDETVAQLMMFLIDTVLLIMVFVFYHYSLILAIEAYSRGGRRFLHTILNFIIGPKKLQSVKNDRYKRDGESWKSVHELAQDLISRSTSLFLVAAYTYSATSLRGSTDMRLHGTTNVAYYALQSHLAYMVHKIVR